MAIVMEKQDAGGGARSAGEEEEEEEPEEEEEVEPEVVDGSAPHRVGSRRDLQLLCLLPVGEHSPQRGSTHSRSSSVTSWDSGSTSLTPDLSELGSKRYSASLDPEELQQELVVKAIRVKKRMRRGRKGRKPVCLLPCLTAGFVSPPRSETLTKGSVLVPKKFTFKFHNSS